MPFPNRNIIAAVAFAFVAIASWDLCAVGQQVSKINDRVKQADNSNPLRPSPLSDLRTGQIEPEVEQSTAAPFGHSTNLLTDSLSPRVAERPPADLDRSFFEQDQPPVVVVWMNSDLHNSVVSERQLKQWMHSGNRQGDSTQVTRIKPWQVNSGSRVRPASFISPAPEGPLLFTRSEQQINEFAKRLNEIQDRLDTKKKQLADESSGDDDGSSGELSNLWNLANDWAGRAKSNLEKLKTETDNKEGFKAKLAAQEKSLAAEKENATIAKPPEESEALPSNLGEALDELQNELKNQQASLQASQERRMEIRERITARDQRVTELPGLLRKIAKEENETKNLIDELKGKADDDLSRSLQKLGLDAKLLSLEITEKSLELEGSRQEQLGRILPLQLEEVALKIKAMEVDLARKSKRSDELRDQEIKERNVAADLALKDVLTKVTPALKDLANYNKELAGDQKDLARKSDELEKELITVRKIQQELDESHRSIKDQIKALGPTASGIRLVEHRRSLISPGKSQNRLLVLAERLQFKQEKKLLLKEHLDKLVLDDRFKLDVLASVEQQVHDAVQIELANIAEQLSEKEEQEYEEKKQQSAARAADLLLETQKQYATDLVEVYRKNIKHLSDLEADHKSLIDKIREVRAFSDKNALWVRSSKPIELNDFKLCQAGLKSVLVSDQWSETVKQAFTNFNKHPYHAGLLALVIGTLLVVRRRLRWSHE